MSKAMGRAIVLLSGVSLGGFFLLSASSALVVSWTSVNTCQKADSILLLQTWLSGHGWLEVTCLLILALTLFCEASQIATTLFVVWLVLRMIWSIWGVLVLFGDHRACIMQGHTYGWMAIWSIFATLASSIPAVLGGMAAFHAG